MTFGQKIYKLRKQKGYSQDELAEKLGVSRQAVSKWELDEMLPDGENAVKIAKMFSVTTDYLLNEKIETNPKKIIPVFQDKYSTVDYLATLSVFGVSISGFCFYRFRLFWQYHTYDESISPKRDSYNYIYMDYLWYHTIDEIVILSFLAIIIIITFIIARKIHKKYK